MRNIRKLRQYNGFNTHEIHEEFNSEDYLKKMGLGHLIGEQYREKREWISEALAIQETALNRYASPEQRSIFEACAKQNQLNESYGTSAPTNISGMGGVSNPDIAGTGGASLNDPSYRYGSGDAVAGILNFATSIAAYTIGFDLLPIIPTQDVINNIQYMDTIYGGNMTQHKSKQETDIIVGFDGGIVGTEIDGVSQVFGDLEAGENFVIAKIPTDKTAVLTSQTQVLFGTFVQKNRIYAYPEIVFKGAVGITASGLAGADRKFTVGSTVDENVAVSDFIGVKAGTGYQWALIKVNNLGGDTVVVLKADDSRGDSAKDIILTEEDGTFRSERVSVKDSTISKFSTPGSDYTKNSPYTVDRETSELGHPNKINFNIKNAQFTVNAMKITGDYTLEQEQDVKGFDLAETIIEAMRVQLTQSIDNHIIEKCFRMGVTNHYNYMKTNGRSLNMLFADPSTTSTKSPTLFSFDEFKNYQGTDVINYFPPVKNSIMQSSAENQMTAGIRLGNRIKYISMLIQKLCRRGMANYAVMNYAMASVLQNTKGWKDYDLGLSGASNQQSIYQFGTLNGIKIYVAPKMEETDGRILIARKGIASTNNESGLRCYVHTLGEILGTTTPEGTWSKKFLAQARYAIEPIGNHPHTNYFTFLVDDDNGNYLI